MTTDERLQLQWANVLDSLRSEIGEDAYKSWLKPMTVRDFNDGRLSIAVPTRFMRDWIVAHYLDRLHILWSAENPDVTAVAVFVQADQGAKVAVVPREIPADGVRAKTPAVGTTVLNGFNYNKEISAPLDPRFTFDQFVVGKPNEFAYAAARRVAEAATVPFNPLFLYGGVGLGKTHLMHAIAWHIRQKDPSRTVIYLSAEKFMYRFIRALREHNTVDFKDQLRSVDVLMIDVVQFISGKDSTQEEFF
ncbi:MAG: DnaA/Hda family protein, partial [Rhodospirillales bacterium]